METIADKSRTKEIIERLQTIMDSASPVPLASGKVMIYKDEVSSLLSELATQMDMEIKTYHEVNDRRGKIINEAKREAERIIYQAETTASRMRVNRRTTNVDPVDFSTLSQDELYALDNANEIYGASLIYTDEMLTEVSNLISETFQNLKNDYDIILNSMEEKLQTLSDNKAELMNGLSEMDGKDRSQQILEIGQLLSNELFNARMNSRRNPDMYDDGSMQLTLDLKTEQEIKAQEAEEKAREAVEAQVEAEAAAKEAEAVAKEAEAAAKEATAAAKEAEEALAKMTAQRDALMEEVSKMKNESREAADAKKKGNSDKETADTPKKEIDSQKATITPNKEAASKPLNEDSNEQEIDASEDEEEYEIVYVTEDELEEGEEYEIEYVDDDEFEDTEAPLLEAVENEEELTTVPMIPHFNKSQKITSVPSEKVARMANAITTDKKYSGLISRAVSEDRTGADKERTGKGAETSNVKASNKSGKDGVHEANMYVQEKFEITEF